MEFGKIHDLAKVNFTLPPDPPANLKILAAQQKASGQKPKAARFLHHYTWQRRAGR